jgi:Uma2 family endonuclease
MSAAIAPQPKPVKKTPRILTLEQFHRLYDSREDDYKYEWHNGIVEKTPRTMNRSQLAIADRILRFFIKSKAFQTGGSLPHEVKMYLPLANRTRVADMAYLDAEKIKEKDDITPSISPFVIEVISKNDTADEIKEKLEEYFADGVQVVWHIYPKREVVEVYTSLENIKICKGETICSAAPAIPDFEVPAYAIFKH